MTNPGFKAARKFEVPLHRFNVPQYKAWTAGGMSQRAMAIMLLRQYPRGFGIVAPQPMFWTHAVKPSSAGPRIESMPTPHKVIEFYELANQPGADTCQCQTFIDHESSEPWGNRRRGHNGTATHHPFCQYDPMCQQTFTDVHQKNAWRPPEAPDAWSKEQIEQHERAGLR